MKTKRLLLWGALLLVLAAVLAAVNLPEKPSSGAQENETAPDFTVTCLNGETFSLSTHRGQTVVLNFWATWCAPCLEELPYFERLQKGSPNVAVLALHAGPVTEDVAAFAKKLGLEIPFAVADDALVSAFGGAEVLPKTVVIAPNGNVTYNAAGKLTYEKLAELVNLAQKNVS